VKSCQQLSQEEHVIVVGGVLKIENNDVKVCVRERLLPRGCGVEPAFAARQRFRDEMVVSGPPHIWKVGLQLVADS
jgi:F0F1-type ATP synthase epsilon subunit